MLTSFTLLQMRLLGRRFKKVEKAHQLMSAADDGQFLTALKSLNVVSVSEAAPTSPTATGNRCTAIDRPANQPVTVGGQASAIAVTAQARARKQALRMRSTVHWDNRNRKNASPGLAAHVFSCVATPSISEGEAGSQLDLAGRPIGVLKGLNAACDVRVGEALDVESIERVNVDAELPAF